MKVMFSFDLNSPDGDTCITLYKVHSMPFCPPIGLEMYMDVCEHTVTKVSWHPRTQELFVKLDGNYFNTREEATKEVSLFKQYGWYDDRTEHLMGD